MYGESFGAVYNRPVPAANSVKICAKRLAEDGTVLNKEHKYGNTVRRDDLTNAAQAVFKERPNTPTMRAEQPFGVGETTVQRILKEPSSYLYRIQVTHEDYNYAGQVRSKLQGRAAAHC